MKTIIKYRKFKTHTTFDLRKLYIIMIFCVLFGCCFFTHDIYGIKQLSIILSGLFAVFLLVKRCYTEDEIEIIKIGIFFPLGLLIISFLANGDISYAISGSYCGFMFVILLLSLHYKIDIEKIIMFVIKLVITVTLLCAALDFFFGYDIFENPILKYLDDIGELAVITKHAQYFSYYKIYIFSSPLAILVSCLSLKNKKYFWWLASGLVLLFTGSTTPVFAFALCSFFYIIELMERKKLLGIFIILCIIFCIGFILISAFYSGNSIDMLVRKSIIEAYIRDFSENPLSLLKGAGYGTPIYIEARKAYEMTTEWSYLEFFREFGVMGGLPFLCIIIKPIKKLYNSEYNWVIYSVVVYILIAFTNPLAYTTTSMVAYILLYYNYFKKMNVDENVLSFSN